METSALAQQLLEECVRDEQAARVVPSSDDALDLRAELRRLARADGLRIRTARVADTVVVVRLDAAVWSESAEQMREKLTPRHPDETPRSAE
ncbi:MAG: hypothetical protein ABI776_17595 [Nocardioidaceae bacterium]